MRIEATRWIGVLALAAASCSDAPGASPPDSASDAAPDAAVDAMPDVPSDTPPDDPIDAPPDVPIDPLDVAFAAAVHYTSNYKPYAVRAHDIDADGDLDLVVANEISSDVVIFRNSGAGAFTASAPVGVGAYPTALVIADFNRDGVADVATADYHGNSVSILLGAGTGAAYTLAAASSYSTVAGAETSNLAVGDLNGDAVPDVIATNPQASSISVFLGNANGTLRAATTIPLVVTGSTTPSEPYAAAIGDFDSDGRADAAIADNRSARLFILLGNGDGTFHATSAQPPIMGVGSFQIIARDMNRDGGLDLVVANRSSDNISVLLGTGTGVFAPAYASTVGAGAGPYSLAIADFNADTIPDVLTANYQTDNASVLLGVGNGAFESPLDAGATGDFTYGVAAGDLDGDGRIDFAAVNALSNTLAVKMSTAQ